MEVILDKQDILNEVRLNHTDDLDFLFEVVESSTSQWSELRKLTIKMLDFLDSQDEIGEIYYEVLE